MATMTAEEIQALKEQVIREVERIAPQLIETSDWMADNPEIGLQEFQAAAKLTDMLEEYGASVDRGIAGMPTAFEARLPGNNPDQDGKVAIIAEYDALADVGHGCGHNIIATAAIHRLGGPELLKHCRKPEIMADAAHAMLTKGLDFTGNFLMDEQVLGSEGIREFAAYACIPGENLQRDLFVGE